QKPARSEGATRWNYPIRIHVSTRKVHAGRNERSRLQLSKRLLQERASRNDPTPRRNKEIDDADGPNTIRTIRPCRTISTAARSQSTPAIKTSNLASSTEANNIQNTFRQRPRILRPPIGTLF